MTCDTRTPAPRGIPWRALPRPPSPRSRALARSRTLRMSVKPNFWTPARSAWPGRAGGAPRAPRPRPATGSSAPPSWRSRGSRPARRSGLSVRPCRTPEVISALSRSIFMRPPRPWPSWRRDMSRSIAVRSSSRPAGRPSTMQVRPGPWDSPAVTTRSGTPSILNRRPPPRLAFGAAAVARPPT